MGCCSDAGKNEKIEMKQERAAAKILVVTKYRKGIEKSELSLAAL